MKASVEHGIAKYEAVETRVNGTASRATLNVVEDTARHQVSLVVTQRTQGQKTTYYEGEYQDLAVTL